MVEAKPKQRSAGNLVGLLIALAITAGCGKFGDDPQQLLADARQQRDKGQFNAAVIQLKNVIAKSPENAEARYLLGITYRDTGDFASAEKELRRALELRYDTEKVMAPLGKALLGTGEFKKVLDEVSLDASAQAGLQAEVSTLRGFALLGLGRQQEAQQTFDQALVQQAEFSEALLGKARIAALNQKVDEAARLVERAIASAPKSPEAWLMKGDLERRPNPEAATAAYRKVLEISPDNVPARVNLALMDLTAGKFDDAAKLIEGLRKNAPANPVTHYLKALLEFRKNNVAAAREALQPALKAAPNYMPAVLLAGVIEYTLGSQAQAQAHLARVVDAAPNNAYARKLLVSSLTKSGQSQRAQEILEPAIKQAPNDSDVLALAGEVALLNNNLSEAGQYFAKAAKLDPKSAGARTGLALSRLASGQTDSALADLESAVQLDSSRYQADILLILSQIRQGSFDQALKSVQTLEKKQPNNPLTYNLKAAVYLGKKDTVNARKQLEHALELQPAYVPAATNLAQLDLQDKNPQAARKRLEAILEKDKNNIQVLLTLANLAPRLGASRKEQIGWLEHAHQADPSSVRASLALARAYVETGEVKKALEVGQQAQAASPDNPEVLDALGAIQLAAGEKNQALSTYGRLVNTQPKSPLALYRLAGAQAANDRRDEASATLKKALSLKADFVDAQIALAQLEVSAGRPESATKIAQQIQKQSPKSPVGFILEGDILAAGKNFARAAKAYESAYALGKTGGLVIKLHAAYAESGKPAEGEARIAQWLKENPDDAAVRLYVADTNLKAGNHKKAIEQYEWLQQKQPDNVLVLNNLAWSYQQLKDPRALSTAERAYKLKPDNAAVADTLGWLLAEQGNLPRAVEILRKAVAMGPKAPEIRFHLAQALAKSGDRAGAKRELEALLSADTKFAQESEARALLEKIRN